MKEVYAKILSELSANNAMLSQVANKLKKGYIMTQTDCDIVKSAYRNNKDEIDQFELQLEKENEKDGK